MPRHSEIAEASIALHTSKNMIESSGMYTEGTHVKTFGLAVELGNTPIVSMLGETLQTQNLVLKRIYDAK